MTISTELRAAFNRYRQWTTPRSRAGTLRPAHDALKQARAALSLGEKHYNSSPWRAPVKSACPQSGKGLFWIENPDACGLREVGRVQAECGGRNGYWDNRGESGWYDNPHGESFKDGSGLVYGVVYQLPGRNGLARFVAGYKSGSDMSEGVTVDLGRIFESESSRGDWYGSIQDHDDAKDAARAADSMASREAEREREYQTAYDNGRQCIEAMREVRESGKDWIAAFRSMRRVFCERWQAVRDDVPIAMTRDWLREAVQDVRELREEYQTARKAAFDKIDEMKPGKYDETNRQAFIAGYWDN
jgi:hypothetical protein